MLNFKKKGDHEFERQQRSKYMGGLAGKKRKNDIISKIKIKKKSLPQTINLGPDWVDFKGPFPPETMRWQEASTADKPYGKCSLSVSPLKYPEELSLTDKSLASTVAAAARSRVIKAHSLPSLPLISSWKPDLKKEIERNHGPRVLWTHSCIPSGCEKGSPGSAGTLGHRI